MNQIAMKKTSRGFTLIEVLLALFILSGGIIVISTAWSGNFMRMRKSVLYNDVATLLERKMIEIEAKYKDKPLTEIPEEDAGDFGSEHPLYTWALKSKDLKLPDLTNMLIGGQEAPDEMLISMVKQVTEFLSTAIKEVRVTVVVKKKTGKPLEFAATQYFMDYTKEFGGAGGIPGVGGGSNNNGNSNGPNTGGSTTKPPTTGSGH